MNTPQRNGMMAVVSAAAMVLMAAWPVPAADAAAPAAGPAAAEKPAAEKAPPPEKPAGDPAAAPAEKPAAPAEKPAEPAPAPPQHVIQISGRVMHTWYEKQDLRVILTIDGFTVSTGKEQLKASDGVVWFDEAQAKKTGRATLGVYAETGVEVRRPGGQVERYDSVYLVMENGEEVSLHSEVPLRGKADSAPLYLRAKKQRREFLSQGQKEAPTAVEQPPQPPAPVPAPGVAEARVPKEITIVPQDDVRKVSFTSFVEDGMRISVWTGGIYIMRGEMEIAADNLVIWTPASKAPEEEGAAEGLSPLKPAKRLAAEAYLEGNVQLNLGRRYTWASQMYYDFERDQALAVNTRIRMFTSIRNVPVIYHAREVRQLAQNLFSGTDAWMTTCDFADPHYEMGARTMTLTDLTPETREQQAAEGEPLPPGEEYRRIRFAGRDVQARIRNVPVTYWPRLAGDLEEGDTALRTIRIENRSNYGTGFLSQWHLLKLLGIQERPKGFQVLLDVDFWSKRGPAVGVEGRYVREDYFGEFRGYYLHDMGSDWIGKTKVTPDTKDRDRLLWRHRQYLPENWELTMELSKVSDVNFLNEFFERESQEDKSQETLLYLKRQENDQALTILTSWRLDNFYTRTEYLPQIGHNVIGHSLWEDRLTYFEDSELARARYRPVDNKLPAFVQYQQELHNPFRVARGARESGTWLFDTIHELDAPINNRGPVRVTPFIEGRTTYFEEVLARTGPEWRWFGRMGARAATQMWRVYDNVENDFWDVHRLRHIHTFDMTAYVAGTNIPSKKLIPFDVTEDGTPTVQGVDRTGVVELGWHQRFQTQRGPEGQRQTVDWLKTDVRFTFFSDTGSPKAVAPDGSRAHNKVVFRSDMLVTDSTTFWTDTQLNSNTGNVDVFSVGVNVEHSPRLGYTLGQRVIPKADSAITFLSFEYRINEKWSITALEQFDWDKKRNALSQVFFTRRMHCWLMRLKLSLDRSENEKLIGIEVQPVATADVKFTAL